MFFFEKFNSFFLVCSNNKFERPNFKKLFSSRLNYDFVIENQIQISFQKEFIT